MKHDASLPAIIPERVWSHLDHCVATGSILKDGDRTTVVRINDDPACPLTLKRYNLKGPLHTTTHVVLRSRAAWCWRTAKALISAGLNVPTPRLMLEERLGPLRLRSAYACDYMEGTPLIDFVKSLAFDDPRLTRTVSEFSRIWSTLGALRAGHGDMKATNFLVDHDARIWLLDLDAVRFHRTRRIFERARARDRERFLRNWSGPDISPGVAERFRNAIDRASAPDAPDSAGTDAIA